VEVAVEAAYRVTSDPEMVDVAIGIKLGAGLVNIVLVDDKEVVDCVAMELEVAVLEVEVDDELELEVRKGFRLYG
jgi:hypothetical protein